MLSVMDVNLIRCPPGRTNDPCMLLCPTASADTVSGSAAMRNAQVGLYTHFFLSLSSLSLWRGVIPSPALLDREPTVQQTESDPAARPPDLSSGFGSQPHSLLTMGRASSPKAAEAGVGCPAQLLFALGIKLLSC